ncbi:MAG: O-antigen ligase family protein [Pseudomonadota bacterium]|nr:O-antigen ligase family protein [Pseudomonadota bacterium]
MPSSIAALLTAAFVGALLLWDRRAYPQATSALWIPVLWMSTTASRYPTQWFSLGAPTSGIGNVAEGSPLDALFFFALIALGVLVLARRRVQLGRLVQNNPWLTAFVVYGLVSIIWSDFPFVSAKRWVKALGPPVMALIILTDPAPAPAFKVVMRRCAFLLLPASVLFIKYFPEYGRGWDAFTGQPFNNGVGLTKNDLGYQCMAFGLVFVWILLTANSATSMAIRRQEVLVSGGMLLVIAWLLNLANSATSVTTLLVGTGLMLILGTKIINRRYFAVYAVFAIGLLATSEWLFGVYDAVIRGLGRDPSLTGRVDVWKDALNLQSNPILGAGFQSFWLGHRLDLMWQTWWWQPIQAHNGYIETYLNLGYVGVLLLGCLLVSTFLRICRLLLTDFDWARFRLAMFVAVLAFNYTEAAFHGVHLIWAMFYIIALQYPSKRAATACAPG